jgi:hypothetical protein
MLHWHPHSHCLLGIVLVFKSPPICHLWPRIAAQDMVHAVPCSPHLNTARTYAHTDAGCCCCLLCAVTLGACFELGVHLHLQLAALLGVKKHAVRMAPDSVVQEVTGFPSGEAAMRRLPLQL